MGDARDQAGGNAGPSAEVLLRPARLVLMEPHPRSSLLTPVDNDAVLPPKLSYGEDFGYWVLRQGAQAAFPAHPASGSAPRALLRVLRCLRLPLRARAAPQGWAVPWRVLAYCPMHQVKLAEHALTGHKVAIKILNRKKIKAMDMDEKGAASRPFSGARAKLQPVHAGGLVGCCHSGGGASAEASGRNRPAPPERSREAPSMEKVPDSALTAGAPPRAGCTALSHSSNSHMFSPPL